MTNTDREFNTVDFDTDNMVDLAADDRKITIQTSGLYLAASQIRYPPNGVGRRIVFILVNGFYADGTGTIVAGDSRPAIVDAGAQTTALAIAPLFLEAGDFVTSGTFQNSGGALTEGGVGAGSQSYFAVARIGV